MAVATHFKVSQRDGDGRGDGCGEQVTFSLKRALRHRSVYKLFCWGVFAHSVICVYHPIEDPMAKKVKFPSSSEAAGKDEIGNDNDDLSLEQYSEAEDDDESEGHKTAGSEDVSDYEGNPRETPRHAYFGADRCRVKFQLKHDAEKNIIWVCGALQECR